MAVATDPSQFAPLPSSAQAGAIARRLNNTSSFNPFPGENQNAPTGAQQILGGTKSPLADPNLINFSPPNDTGKFPGDTSIIPVGSTINRPPVQPPNSVTGIGLPTEAGGGNIATGGGSAGGDVTNPLSGGTGDPALDSFLAGDTTYQGQLNDLLRQLDNYNAQRNLQMTQTQADYDAKQRALDTQSGLDRQQMLDNFAARGILNSGIYANSLGQYNQNNQQQITNMLGGLQNYKDNAQLAYNQFITNELAAKANAIQQAAARRAAQLGQF